MDANNVRQRLEQVVVQCGFNLVTEKSDKLSHYYEFRHKGALTMTVIRISNHCTDISTWRERYGSINPTIQLSNKEKRRYRGNYAGLNDKYFQKYFFSIVVFDPTTDGVQNCGDVNDGSIFVKQIVYDATKMTNENLVDCENFVKKIASGNITENINYNRIMKKNRIRLTESQLRQIVKESVDSILKEGQKKKDPMSQWFNDFNKASKYRETMDYVNKGGRNPLSKEKEDDEVSESYNKLNGLHRLAYENQGMKEKIKEVAQFADIVAGVADSEGRDNYAKFYKPLASNIFQMLNLWGFLDNIDD